MKKIYLILACLMGIAFGSMAQSLYTITVTNGKAYKLMGSMWKETVGAAEGVEIKIEANSPEEGMVFDKWVVESGDITLTDANASTTYFTMPASSVSITATYKSIDDRTPISEITATSDIEDLVRLGNECIRPLITLSEGSVATINMSYSHWVKKNEEGEWDNLTETVFTPGTYKFVTVEVRIDGDNGSLYKLADDFVFKVDGVAWTSVGESYCGDGYSYRYVNSPEYVLGAHPVIIHNGKALKEDPEVGFVEVTEAYSGDNLMIVANTPESGQRFNEWTIQQGNIALSIEPYYTILELTMPDESIEITATYRDEGELINELTLTGLYKPVPGVIPTFNSGTMSDNVMYMGIWIVKKGDSFVEMPTTMEDDYNLSYTEAFEEGKEYGYSIISMPNEGYDFSYDLKVYFNDKELPWVEMMTPADFTTGCMFNPYCYGRMLLTVILEEDMPSDSGVKGVIDDTNGLADVYNLQGIKVMSNASKESIRQLPAGIYIINNKKIVVK